MAGRIAYYGNTVTNGLVLSLDAAKRDSYPGSGIAWRDISGNGNNGTLTNGPTYTSDNGGAITFDGIDDYATMGASIDFSTYTSGFTIDLWTYPTSAASFGSIFSSAAATGGTSWQVYIWYNTSNQFGTAQRYSGLQNDFTSSVIFPINNWYNVSVTSNNTTSYIYVNGINRASKLTGQINNQPIDREVRLGNFKAYPAQYTGRIANCKVYNKALSDSEILQNYNAVKSRYGL